MKNEAVFDFETLSLKAWNCVAVTMAIVYFDRSRFTSDNPYDLSLVEDVINYKLDPVVQVKQFKYDIEKDTIKWWESQPKEVMRKILPAAGDLSPKDFCVQVLRDAKSNSRDIKRWYSRGNNFDPVILRRLMSDNGLDKEFDKIFHFGNVRDVRTVIDENIPGGSTSFVPCKDENRWNKWFKAHDAAFDVVADVLRLQVIERAKNDLEPFTV